MFWTTSNARFVDAGNCRDIKVCYCIAAQFGACCSNGGDFGRSPLLLCYLRLFIDYIDTTPGQMRRLSEFLQIANSGSSCSRCSKATAQFDTSEGSEIVRLLFCSTLQLSGICLLLGLSCVFLRLIHLSFVLQEARDSRTCTVTLNLLCHQPVFARSLRYQAIHTMVGYVGVQVAGAV